MESCGRGRRQHPREGRGCPHWPAATWPARRPAEGGQSRHYTPPLTRSGPSPRLLRLLCWARFSREVVCELLPGPLATQQPGRPVHSRRVEGCTSGHDHWQLEEGMGARCPS